MIWVGIDTGKHTGIAVWDGSQKQFLTIEELPIHAALLRVLKLAEGNKVKVIFEDARQRTWYDTYTPLKDRARLQGAGSIKRDCTIWEDALKDWGIEYYAVPPKDNMTKLTAETFRMITKWKGRTNEHSRDAAMLVYNR